MDLVYQLQFLEEPEELPPVSVLSLVIMELTTHSQEPAGAAALIARQSQVWLVLLVAISVAAAAVARPLTTDLRLALAVLAASARSTSSPTANL